MLRDGIFRKAEGSETHGCVEVAADATGVRVRDSKDRAGPVLSFTDDEWTVFTRAVREGQFNLP